MTTDSSAWRSFAITNSDEKPFNIKVRGRNRWALEQLIGAQGRGCTPIDHPGPRWSAYVFNLRELGLEIDTLNEKHSGPFEGWHGRYVLLSLVTPKDEGADE